MLDHFGIHSYPFLQIIPAEKLMVVHSQERTIAALERALNRKEIGMVIGEVGVGKTKVVERLIERIPHSKYKLLFLAEPQEATRSIWKYLLGQMGIQQSGFHGFRLLHQTLLLFQKESSRQPVLIVDEAHELRMQTISELRFLCNATPEGLCPILLILIGQPLLGELLKNPKHEAFNQRIGCRHRLLPLGEEECFNYIDYHMHLVGTSQSIFDKCSKQFIFSYTRGIPRRVNQVCLSAMEMAFEKKRSVIDEELVKLTVEELLEL